MFLFLLLHINVHQAAGRRHTNVPTPDCSTGFSASTALLMLYYSPLIDFCQIKKIFCVAEEESERLGQNLVALVLTG